ncbi:MAG: DUF1385 domain-containing protein [Cyanobacteria bacterium NC_groundwater_1444_Ag_S-0.65um_54_12]|nr:DUF1385 domain-containing protein [Cyanobacteria bacterium NC_groundwater_1444_Ag_S-0.65um_54_12]
MSSKPIVVDPIGGQAVIEGVMMRSNAGVSMAVRVPAGHIEVRYLPVRPWRERYPLLRMPFLRGIATLIESLLIGFRMLEESANLAVAEPRPTKQSAGGMALSLALGLAIAICLFVIAPAWLYTSLPAAWNAPLRSLIEGGVRLGIFVLYIVAVGFLQEMQRIFEYHGAEHQTIRCYEAGKPLEVANARVMSPLHPRCGTSFLLLTLLVGIVVFSFLPRDLPLWARAISKLGLLPVVAGFSYELIRLAGKASREGASASWGARLVLLVTVPGLWLQYLTTRPARDEMLEVAIASLKRALVGNNEPLSVQPGDNITHP